MLSQSLDGIDPKKFTTLEEIKEAYDQLCKEEKIVDERLEWNIGNRHRLEARLSQLAHLVPTLQIVQADARKLENTISFTCQLANNVSAKVRELDIAKGRVSEVQKRVGDLLDLEGCAGGVATALSQEDYEKAAGHIYRFLSMDETVLRHSADSANKGENFETWFERLKNAESKLREIINQNFDEAVRREDEASIERFFKLFPLLNKHEEGLAKFTNYLCSKIRAKSEKNLSLAKQIGPRDKRAHIIWADTITLLFEEIARVIEIRQPIIETYYWRLCIVVELLQEECDRIANGIISNMQTQRKLNNILSTVQEALRMSNMAMSSNSSKDQIKPSTPDPRDLDTLSRRADYESSIEDKHLRKQKIEMFETKLSRSQVVCDMAVVIGNYTILEQFYLNESFRKAVALDSGEGQNQTSSLVDDAFYIIKKSVRRAIASSSVDGVCAMLNHSVDLLERQLAAGFHQTLRKGFPVQGYLDLTQTALNNAEISCRHVNSLQNSLRETIDSAMKDLSPTDSAKLESCLSDLKATSGRFRSVVDFGLSQLQATAIKPKVKPWVDTFTTISHDITEEELSAYEANDPFSQQLMVQIDGLLGSFIPLLTTENHKSLVEILVKEVASQLEKAVFKSTFNRFGGLQFDREVRAIAGYLSQVSEWSVREQLARLTQMATLLNLENLSEVSEYSTCTTWRLTPTEMKKTLQLRMDFKYEDIQRLKL
ncbi:Conserved oligomeric Golgi complex subunit 4 [Armadillidium nasatum]|uniref:Conserved oligomeric Golgi complex subunit 4 n=1 Tax=Armadillidium nasatum TaxID=96803 RepID=A0A5N5SKD6_9CRUS|nr:Conserved oligomeric Golgi complex subunit 4 [Armadillidium nasatum]